MQGRVRERGRVERVRVREKGWRARKSIPVLQRESRMKMGVDGGEGVEMR